MPKLIENLKEKYIETGKQILMSEGYKALTLRMVAKKCDVALGTIYNYFKNKDELVANIMINDWLKLLNETKTNCEQIENPIEGIRIIYEMIRKFSDIYSFIWKESRKIVPQDKHIMLVSQTSKLVSIVLNNNDMQLSGFIAELLINYGIKEIDEYKNIEKYIDKLIRN